MKDDIKLTALVLIGLLMTAAAAPGNAGEISTPSALPAPVGTEAPSGKGAPEAGDLSRLRMRALAGVCASCHGTDGRSVAGSLIPTLAGMPREYMREQFQDFLDGNRPATLMPQILKGLTPAQMDDLATYFSRIPRLSGAAP